MLLYLAPLVAFTGSTGRMMQVEPKKTPTIDAKYDTFNGPVCMFVQKVIGQKNRLPIGKARPA